MRIEISRKRCISWPSGEQYTQMEIDLHIFNMPEHDRQCRALFRRGVDETHSQKTRRLDGIFHFHPFRRRLCVKHDHLQLLILMCWCDDDAMHQHNFMQSPQAHQFVVCVCVYVMREWVLVQNSLCVWGSSSPIWISTRINMFSIIHFKMWIINSICWMTCAPMIAETHAHT